MSKVCQSCGMPIKRDPEQGGTRADGTKTDEYCSYCFVEGKFMQPEMSATEMQTFCIEKMKEQGIPKLVGWLFTRSIPKLKRWQTA